MTDRSGWPIALGAKPALAIVAIPVINAALTINDRTICIFLLIMSRPSPESKTMDDELLLNANEKPRPSCRPWPGLSCAPLKKLWHSDQALSTSQPGVWTRRARHCRRLALMSSANPVDFHKIVRHGEETTSRLASKRGDGRFDFSVAMNGRCD
jgi:hypothetical protein